MTYNFELPISSIELAYPITFKEYFASELEKLQLPESGGLVNIEDDRRSMADRYLEGPVVDSQYLHGFRPLSEYHAGAAAIFKNDLTYMRWTLMWPI